MRRGLLGALVAALVSVVLLVWPAQAEPSATNPTPRAVADAMQDCLDGPVSIIGPSAPSEAGAVIVNTPGGTFAIKELNTLRLGNAAVLMITRNPRFSLLHVTFPERVGSGRLDTNADDNFQRQVVDCFYGKYLGQDIL